MYMTIRGCTIFTLLNKSECQYFAIRLVSVNETMVIDKTTRNEHFEIKSKTDLLHRLNGHPLLRKFIEFIPVKIHLFNGEDHNVATFMHNLKTSTIMMYRITAILLSWKNSERKMAISRLRFCYGWVI